MTIRSNRSHDSITEIPKAKVAFITGSAQGIGRAMALHLAQQGITVIVHYVSSRTQAETVLQIAQTTAPDSSLLQGDVSLSSDVTRMFQTIMERYGQLDILINNVGNFGQYHKIDQVTEAEFDDVINSNVRGTFLCMKQAMPLLQQSPFGRIINMACVTAESNQARQFTVPYYIAKGGIVTLTKSWAQTAIQHGMTINAIAPGVVENSIIQQDQPLDQSVSYADITHAMDFLLAESSHSITGSVVDVTGGWTPGYQSAPQSTYQSAPQSTYQSAQQSKQATV